jgi:hypothetical protein
MLYIAVLPLRDLDLANRRPYCNFIDIVSTRGSGPSFTVTPETSSLLVTKAFLICPEYRKGVKVPNLL